MNIEYRTAAANPYERAVLEVCEKALRDAGPLLAQREITGEVRGIVDRGSQESEVVIDFLQGGSLVDRIEFHLIRGGQQAQEPEDLRGWLTMALRDVG